MTDTNDRLPDTETQSPEPNGDRPEWFVRLTGVGSRVGQALLIPTLALVAALVVGAFIIAFTEGHDVDAIAHTGCMPRTQTHQYLRSALFETVYKLDDVQTLGHINTWLHQHSLL